MERFINAVEKSLDAENWFGALFITLALPDICASLETPGAKVGVRYRRWFDKYLQKRYAPKNDYEMMTIKDPESLKTYTEDQIKRLKQKLSVPQCSFTAKDCYAARNACLHQGSAVDKVNDFDFYFTAPIADNIHVNRVAFDGKYQIQIDTFCIDVCNAVRKWASDVSNDKAIQDRISGLLQITTDPLNGLIKIETPEE